MQCKRARCKKLDIEKLFDGIDVLSMSSWEQFELNAAVHALDISFDMFACMMCFAAMIKQMYDVMKDAVESSAECKKLIHDVKAIQLIVELYGGPF